MELSNSVFRIIPFALKVRADKLRSSVAMLNYLPIAGQGLQLISELLFSGFSGYFGVHLPFLLLHSVNRPFLIRGDDLKADGT